MALDKLVDSSQLNTDLTSVANAIRTKGGTSAQLAFPADFVSAIEAISGGGGAPENITVSFTNNKASGSINIGYPYYVGSIDAITISSVSIGAGATKSFTIWNQNGVLGFGGNTSITAFSYNGEQIPLKTTGYGGARKYSITLPDAFDPSVPLVFE